MVERKLAQEPGPGPGAGGRGPGDNQLEPTPEERGALARWIAARRVRDSDRYCRECGCLMEDALAVARYHPACRQKAASRRRYQRQKAAQGQPVEAPEPPDIMIG